MHFSVYGIEITADEFYVLSIQFLKLPPVEVSTTINILQTVLSTHFQSQDLS